MGRGPVQRAERTRLVAASAVAPKEREKATAAVVAVTDHRCGILQLASWRPSTLCRGAPPKTEVFRSSGAHLERCFSAEPRQSVCEEHQRHRCANADDQNREILSVLNPPCLGSRLN